jgi:hypothetical protein
MAMAQWTDWVAEELSLNIFSSYENFNDLLIFVV